ncbi:MAG: 50S ribosomal protein L13 [Candidatus Andersenbacteria bacterium]
MRLIVDKNRLRTRTAQPRNFERRWHVIDAKGAILGRTATQVAELLSGRRKASWSPQADVGDHVVVLNTPGVRLTGRKTERKIYYKHTTYLGHLKATPYQRMAERRPNEVVAPRGHGHAPAQPPPRQHDSPPAPVHGERTPLR